ncbi:MAG: metal-dependent hydrolase [Candidatus Woesearchaeota archaeon]|nr:MAG: metal-dependent hydrolase [Candidatus Woesearchaeota archaeon]
MKWITHIGFSVLIFLIIKELFEITSQTTIFLSLIFCIFGGLLPDIDIHFKFLSKHREVLHSSIGLAVLSLFIFIIFRILNLNIVTFCFIFGYFFHLFLDSFTRMGIKWLPLTKKSKGGVKTGGFKEKVITIVIWILVIIFALSTTLFN